MAKPEKRLSAFSIELRGANFWSARTMCDAWRSVREVFGTRRSEKILGIAQTVPQVDDPALQKLHYEHAERMLLASFTSGFIGTPWRDVRFSSPKNMQEALRIAVTVQQVELQERRNETFYVDEVQERGKADRSSRETRRSGYMRNTTQQVGASRTQDQSCKGSSRNLRRVNS